MKFGAHVSVAGGLDNGPREARSIGADVMQIFTRNQRQWAAKPVTDEEAVAFRDSVKKEGITCVMSHASYLLNLAAPTAAARKKSSKAFREELARCGKLGVQLLNFHPGAHLGGGDKKALAFVAECLREAIESTPDAGNVLLVIENTAGQGSCVGHKFEHLSELLEQTGHPERLGICLDTQHSFAAGYDLRTPEGEAAALDEFDRRVGLKHVKAFHLNDSKVEFARCVDRHEDLGKGAIGFGLFARLATDPRFADIPGFLETPGGPPTWKKEIAKLKKAAKGAGAGASAKR
jgi:deoxyribonuclease-4